MATSGRTYRHSPQNVLKIAILGEGGVGKTTLTKRIITGIFDAKTRMTIGVDFHLLKTSIFDPLAPEDADDVPQIDIQAQIWDFAGESRFRFMLPRYCKGAVGGALCYDLSRYSTTKYIDEWYQIWKDNAPENSPIILVGTKADLIAENDMDEAQQNLEKLAHRLNIPDWYIISAKNGRNVHILTNDLLIKAYIFNQNWIKSQKKQ
ncbi:MAG: GTP-binding protein [Candidatus Lokiarchaeota archaeon]|nr:GTP-binding protein [Candidatus Harpocratesius repetitus]